MKKILFPSHPAQTDKIVNRYEEISSFFIGILPSASFTERHNIRNGCFFDSLFSSAADTISKNLFLVLEMTPYSANTISEHGQTL